MTASSQATDVLIVGAGLAGLSAALALSGTGLSVRVLERRPILGGRAYSYEHPTLGEIDSQHILLGCCTNLLDLLRLSGADRHLRWYDRFNFLEPESAGLPPRVSVINPTELPAPFHSGMSFLGASMLGVKDKIGVAQGLLEFLRGYPESDEEAFSEWLARTKQSERAVRHFWEPIVLGALNDGFESCSTRYAGKVFHESFLSSAEGARFGIPALPLSDFFAPTARLAVQRGTDLQEKTTVERMERVQSGGWRVVCGAGKVFEAGSLVLAVNFDVAAKLLAGVPQTETLRSNLKHFRHAPITTVHLWYDRDVTGLDHAALLGTRIQWVFNKTRIRRVGAKEPVEPFNLELTISGSFLELHEDRETILRRSIAELESFFPEARTARLVRSGVLKEAKATFSVTPGLDQFRPEAKVGEGLFLAGDWTRTGWPSTMEGAVRSGRLAAEAVCRDHGDRRTLLTPDLPPEGLMRLLARRRA